MESIPQTNENASPQPLICKKCGAEVPANKLACDCFVIYAERERRAKKIEAYYKGFGNLYLATGSTIRMQRHILPAPDHCLSLCELQRYKRKRESRIITVRDNLKDLDACEKCVWVLGKKKP